MREAFAMLRTPPVWYAVIVKPGTHGSCQVMPSRRKLMRSLADNQLASLMSCKAYTQTNLLSGVCRQTACQP